MRPPQNKGPPMNDKIPFPEMRVVVANADGKDDMLGVMSKDEALARAEDLVPCAPAPLPRASDGTRGCLAVQPRNPKPDPLNLQPDTSPPQPETCGLTGVRPN